MIDRANIPAPGSGCHPAILGEANRQAHAGKSAPDIFSTIRRSIPKGNRHVYQTGKFKRPLIRLSGNVRAQSHRLSHRDRKCY